MVQKILLTVKESESGSRLDAYIGAAAEALSRSHAVKLIESGCVTVNGRTEDKKYRVSTGETVEIDMPEAKEYEAKPQAIPLDIVYEDDDLLVVNKKQGMVVHPAPGNYEGTLVNALMEHCGSGLSGINGVMRPGIVHRIDKDTSGLLVVAKNDAAHMFLSSQLADRSLSREYSAIVNGNIKEDTLTLDFPIGRNPSDRKKMCVTNKNSRNAVTHVTVLERFGRYTYVKCKLQTGRTHQIRVHMAYIGHSIVGDKTYGIKKERFKLDGQLLHAGEIEFIHPATKERMEFSCELPDYFLKVLEKLRSESVK